MRLIERYLFRQITYPVLGATVALTVMGLLGNSLSMLSLIVERGQNPWVLIEVTLLGMPQLMSLILPIAVFVGALLALNRLQSDHEFVVCFAGGMTAAGAPFLESIRRHAQTLAFPVPAARCAIRYAELGNDAGFIGAAGCARQLWLRQRQL